VLTAILAVEERLKQHRIFVLAVHDLGSTFCDGPGGLVCLEEARIWKAFTALLAHVSVSCEVDNWGGLSQQGGDWRFGKAVPSCCSLVIWKENFVVSLVSLVSLVRLERRNPTTRTQ